MSYVQKRLLCLILCCAIYLSLAPCAEAFLTSWEYKVAKKVLIEKYEKEKYRNSGYQLMEEYMEKTMQPDVTKRKIDVSKTPPDGYLYVPHPTYAIAKYNMPPGTPELHLARKFKFDRQENHGGIASPDFKLLVYPAVYYYATANTTACDLFVIPLPQEENNRDKILKANVTQRIDKPIISTVKNIDENDIFRSLTPIDFSPDSSRLLVKEKTGNIHDGIWSTSVWVYDFTTKKATRLDEVRQAVAYYWKNSRNLNLDEHRWDIFPLGFDLNDPNKIFVSAYGYTGHKPKFLGLWAIDVLGEETQLVSLFNTDVQVSVNGFKLVQDGTEDYDEVIANQKNAVKYQKIKNKREKKELKKAEKERKKALEKSLKDLKNEYKADKKKFDKRMKKSGPTS